MKFPETNDEATTNIYWWNLPPDPPSNDLDDLTEEEMETLARELTELAERSLGEAKRSLGIIDPPVCQCGAKYDTVAIHYRWCKAWTEEE